MAETATLPEEYVKSIRNGEARAKAKAAGRLFRIKHQAFGHALIEAKDAGEAAHRFATERCPGESQDAEWIKRFAKECRIARVGASK